MVAVPGPEAVAAAPAQATWHSYVSRDIGFSVEMQGEVKARRGTYREAIAGPRQTDFDLTRKTASRSS